MAGNKKPNRKYVPGRALGNVVPLTEVNKKLDGTYVDRNKYAKLYRHHVTRITKAIASGEVTEEDMEKLHNFHQFALAAMERMSMADIDKAWRNAEAMSILHHDMQIPVVDEPGDYSVIHDPNKLESDHD